MERRLLLKGAGGLCAVALLAPQAHALLTESISRFDTQPAGLRAFVPDAAVDPALARLGQEWERYCALLVMSPTCPLTSEVYSASDLTRDAAHPLAPACEKSACTAAERLVNVAGRQRMPTRRRAKFCLFQARDTSRSPARMERNWARSEFSSGRHQLYKAATDSPGIHAPLAEFDRHCIGYRNALAADRASPPLAAVAGQSEQILATTEQLVTLFEQRSMAA